MTIVYWRDACVIIRDDEKLLYCYSCRKVTLFVRRDMHNNSGVESHCSECVHMCFEWQNRAVEREKEKWMEHNMIPLDDMDRGNYFLK